MKSLILATVLATTFPASASAAVAVAVSVEELARGSELVVRGRVAGVSSRWAAGGRRIFTFVELETSRTLRGSAAERTTVLVPGGIVGDLGQRVDGAPTFVPGEEVVVFLHRAEAGAYRVTGLAQGKFAVHDGVARPDLSRTALVASTLRAGERAAEPMPVAELERRVSQTP